jgi:2-iminoacetate synthase
MRVSQASPYLPDSFFHHLLRLRRLEGAYPPFSAHELNALVRQKDFGLSDLPRILSISDTDDLTLLFERAREVTEIRHGRKMNLFAPLYVSNYCASSCSYCGFSTEVRQKRVTLSLGEIEKEAAALKNKGFRQVLVVSGEFKVRRQVEMFRDIVALLSTYFDAVLIEVQSLSEEQYADLLAVGLDGVTLYQEVYNEEAYATFHRRGYKSDYRYRLEAPERIAESGIPLVNMGILLGLADWKEEVFFLAAHIDYLQKKYWKVQFGLSFPRIVEEGIHFKTPVSVSELDLAKIIASMRLVFPDAPISLSTRERAYFRDHMIPFGITHMSAESKTMPGGYAAKADALAQFKTSDQRSLEEVVAKVSLSGKDPVFKDWDQGLRRN